MAPETAPTPQQLTIPVDGHGSVSALYEAPGAPRALYVFAHGAGAGMQHVFMQQAAAGLLARGFAVLRYQFLYMERGSRRPDWAPLLEATVRAAVEAAHRLAPDLPLFAGGKSMGGRMTSRAAAASPLPHVEGLIFIGFPLHPAGKPGTERAEHLADVQIPMLFLQGTRDKLAQRELLDPVVEALQERATLHWSDGADHGFHVLKRSGRTDGEVLGEILDRAAEWVASLDARGS